MINPSQFVKALKDSGIHFFTGVPDTLLKEFCTCIAASIDKSRHVTAASEGGAVALAAGYHLATGKLPLVYMQNSGIGNAVNPLLSLTDKEVYAIPMLLLISWRGEPGVNDEPQHIKQGRIQNQLLDAMEIPYTIIDKNTKNIDSLIMDKIQQARELSAPVALIVRKGTFSSVSPEIKSSSNIYPMTREEAIEIILSTLPNSIITVSTTGKASREVFEIRERRGDNHANDFLTVGSMGHSSMIALGIAMAKPQSKVVCLDGDGAALMQMGALPVIGTSGIKNIIHIVLNNCAHDSVGGQPTAGFHTKFARIAKDCGYEKCFLIRTASFLSAALKQARICQKSMFIEVRIATGARPDLGRPTTTPLQNKLSLMDTLAIKR